MSAPAVSNSNAAPSVEETQRIPLFELAYRELEQCTVPQVGLYRRYNRQTLRIESVNMEQRTFVGQMIDITEQSWQDKNGKQITRPLTKCRFEPLNASVQFTVESPEGKPLNYTGNIRWDPEKKQYTLTCEHQKMEGNSVRFNLILSSWKEHRLAEYERFEGSGSTTKFPAEEWVGMYALPPGVVGQEELQEYLTLTTLDPENLYVSGYLRLDSDSSGKSSGHRILDCHEVVGMWDPLTGELDLRAPSTNTLRTDHLTSGVNYSAWFHRNANNQPCVQFMKRGNNLEDIPSLVWTSKEDPVVLENMDKLIKLNAFVKSDVLASIIATRPNAKPTQLMAPSDASSGPRKVIKVTATNRKKPRVNTSTAARNPMNATSIALVFQMLSPVERFRSIQTCKLWKEAGFSQLSFFVKLTHSDFHPLKTDLWKCLFQIADGPTYHLCNYDYEKDIIASQINCSFHALSIEDAEKFPILTADQYADFFKHFKSLVSLRMPVCLKPFRSSLALFTNIALSLRLLVIDVLVGEAEHNEQLQPRYFPRNLAQQVSNLTQLEAIHILTESPDTEVSGWRGRFDTPFPISGQDLHQLWLLECHPRLHSLVIKFAVNHKSFVQLKEKQQSLKALKEESKDDSEDKPASSSNQLPPEGSEAVPPPSSSSTKPDEMDEWFGLADKNQQPSGFELTKMHCMEYERLESIHDFLDDLTFVPQLRKLKLFGVEKMLDPFPRWPTCTTQNLKALFICDITDVRSTFYLLGAAGLTNLLSLHLHSQSMRERYTFGHQEKQPPGIPDEALTKLLKGVGQVEDLLLSVGKWNLHSLDMFASVPNLTCLQIGHWPETLYHVDLSHAFPALQSFAAHVVQCADNMVPFLSLLSAPKVQLVNWMNVSTVGREMVKTQTDILHRQRLSNKSLCFKECALSLKHHNPRLAATQLYFPCWTCTSTASTNANNNDFSKPVYVCNACLWNCHAKHSVGPPVNQSPDHTSVFASPKSLYTCACGSGCICLKSTDTSSLTAASSSFAASSSSIATAATVDYEDEEKRGAVNAASPSGKSGNEVKSPIRSATPAKAKPKRSMASQAIIASLALVSPSYLPWSLPNSASVTSPSSSSSASWSMSSAAASTSSSSLNVQQPFRFADLSLSIQQSIVQYLNVSELVAIDCVSHSFQALLRHVNTIAQDLRSSGCNSSVTSSTSVPPARAAISFQPVYALHVHTAALILYSVEQLRIGLEATTRNPHKNLFHLIRHWIVRFDPNLKREDTMKEWQQFFVILRELPFKLHSLQIENFKIELKASVETDAALAAAREAIDLEHENNSLPSRWRTRCRHNRAVPPPPPVLPSVEAFDPELWQFFREVNNMAQTTALSELRFLQLQTSMRFMGLFASFLPSSLEHVQLTLQADLPKNVSSCTSFDPLFWKNVLALPQLQTFVCRTSMHMALAPAFWTHNPLVWQSSDILLLLQQLSALNRSFLDRTSAAMNSSDSSSGNAIIAPPAPKLHWCIPMEASVILRTFREKILIPDKYVPFMGDPIFYELNDYDKQGYVKDEYDCFWRSRLDENPDEPKLIAGKIVRRRPPTVYTRLQIVEAHIPLSTFTVWSLTEQGHRALMKTKEKTTIANKSDSSNTVDTNNGGQTAAASAVVAADGAVNVAESMSVLDDLASRQSSDDDDDDDDSSSDEDDPALVDLMEKTHLVSMNLDDCIKVFKDMFKEATKIDWEDRFKRNVYLTEESDDIPNLTVDTLSFKDPFFPTPVDVTPVSCVDTLYLRHCIISESFEPLSRMFPSLTSLSIASAHLRDGPSPLRNPFVVFSGLRKLEIQKTENFLSLRQKEIYYEFGPQHSDKLGFDELANVLASMQWPQLEELMLTAPFLNFARIHIDLSALLSVMPHLTALTLAHISVNSIEGFKHCPQLKRLHFFSWPSQSQGTPADLKPLFPSLQRLHVDHYKRRFPSKRIVSLLQDLPNLKWVNWMSTKESPIAQLKSSDPEAGMEEVDDDENENDEGKNDDDTDERSDLAPKKNKKDASKGKLSGAADAASFVPAFNPTFELANMKLDLASNPFAAAFAPTSSSTFAPSSTVSTFAHVTLTEEEKSLADALALWMAS